MSSDTMCNGHKFVKSSLFQSPGYLADLSPYISAVISSRIFTTPFQLTASAIKPLAPLAQSILPTRASNFILQGTLTCEYCLHQVNQDAFDDGRPCPSLLLERLGIADDTEFVLADQLLEAQDRLHAARERRQSQVEAEATSDRTTVGKDESSQSSSTTGGQVSQSSSSTTLPRVNLSPLEKSAEEQQKPPSYHGEADRYREDLLIIQICPEIGLLAQSFSCVDCKTTIDLSSSRLCHYDGRYYCMSCHSGSDLLPIPARVLRNWDFTPKPVSKSSLQKICFLRTKPVLFNLFHLNTMLYGFIDRLVEIKSIRENVQSMLKYIEVCGQPDKPYLAQVPSHFLNENLLNFFTLNDLFDINQVHEVLKHIQTTLETHIVRKCESCRGKGYYCELCKDSHDVLYPFSKNGAICNKCRAVYHKNCFHRKKKNCPRCLRLNQKRSVTGNVGDNSSGASVDGSSKNEPSSEDGADDKLVTGTDRSSAEDSDQVT